MAHVKYTTTYDEENSIQTLLGGRTIPVKAAVERILPWLDGVPWEIDSDTFPYIISINIKVKQSFRIPFTDIRPYDIFLPVMEADLPHYMAGVWKREPMSCTTDKFWYNAARLRYKPGKYSLVFFNGANIMVHKLILED